MARFRPALDELGVAGSRGQGTRARAAGVDVIRARGELGNWSVCNPGAERGWTSRAGTMGGDAVAPREQVGGGAGAVGGGCWHNRWARLGGLMPGWEG